MSVPTTSEDIRNVIFSQGLADGPMLSGLQDGMTTDLFGQEVVPANRSASVRLRMEERRASTINATFGRVLPPSSQSERLQMSLASKLQMRLNGDGSIRFSGTWKMKITPARRRYFQLLPSRQTMKERGFSGWPTPTARDGKDISTSKAFLSQRQRHSPSMATRLLDQGAPWTVITAVYALAMGYPLQWNDARPRDTATQLSRKSRQSS